MLTSTETEHVKDSGNSINILIKKILKNPWFYSFSLAEMKITYTWLSSLIYYYYWNYYKVRGIKTLREDCIKTTTAEEDYIKTTTTEEDYIKTTTTKEDCIKTTYNWR